jgi:anti-sigma factor RsiW
VIRVRRRRLVCRQAIELMTAYLEGTLAPADRRRLEAHLAGCTSCTEYLAQLQAILRAAGRAEPDDLSPAAADELVSLFRRWRDEGRTA